MDDRLNCSQAEGWQWADWAVGSWAVGRCAVGRWADGQWPGRISPSAPPPPAYLPICPPARLYATRVAGNHGTTGRTTAEGWSLSCTIVLVAFTQ